MYYIFLPPDNISYPNPNIEFLSKSLELKVDLTSLMISDRSWEDHRKNSEMFYYKNINTYLIILKTFTRPRNK